MLGAMDKVTKKRCPRCGGNIFLDTDVYGRFEHCLRCGHTKDMNVTENEINIAHNKGQIVSGGLK